MPTYQISFVVYRFTSSGFNASYIGETTLHLTTTIKEHLKTDSKSHFFKQFSTDKNCKELCDTECLEIIETCFKIVDKTWKNKIELFFATKRDS